MPMQITPEEGWAIWGVCVDFIFCDEFVVEMTWAA
jgi:hypothetical protein